MKNILLIGLILFSMNVIGQVHSIGVQGGVNLSNYTSKIDFGDTEFRTGILSGFNYEYLYKGKYTLGADLLYSQQGFKEDLKFYIVEEDVFRPSNVKFNYNYLSLPVKFGYTIGHQLKGFVKMGICPSVLLNAKVKVPKDDINLAGFEEINFYNKIPKFDLGGLIEFGAAYELKNEPTPKSQVLWKSLKLKV